MANYSYIMINKNGKEKKGTMEADTIKEVKSQLRVAGNIPIHISEQSVLNKDINISIGKPVKARQLCIFCRQFASLLSAGLTMSQALGMLSRHSDNKHLTNAIKKIQASIVQGETLAESMKEHDKIFPSFMIYMIEAGETSGNLDTAFIKVSDHFEKEDATKSQVRKAMIYPIAILLVMFIVIFIMMIYVIPNFAEMFAGMDTELPLLTRMVMHMSDFFVKWWYVIIGIMISIIIGINFYRKTPSGKKFFGGLALRLPLFGSLTIKSAASNFAGSISTLISTGIPMIESIDITAKTMKNTIVKQALYSVRDDVSEGLALSEPLSDIKIFPQMVSDMIAIGEETGDIDGMLNNLAIFYDEEVKVATEELLAVMQPLIIIVMAGMVGVFIGAMMSPIIKMYQVLG